MAPKVAGAELTEERACKKPGELDDKTRLQYFAIMQYFTDHDLVETLSVFERETGLQYSSGCLPMSSMLEKSLNAVASQNRGGNSITIDEHGLPRLPDGRRWVEVMHAPWYLETPSHVIPLVAIAAYFYFSNVFETFEIWNIIIHLLVFIPTVHIPALVTGKMSWIDLSWPLGLLALGLQIWFLGSAPFWRRGVAGLEYFLIGWRMTAWILANWNIVRKGRELPRYQYRRLVWEDRPFFFGLVTNTSVSMQLEICEQWVWNVTWLCLPAMLNSFNTQASWHALEILGHVIWAVSFVCETLGDQQKYAFVMKCQKEGVEARLGRKGGKVCNVGLWRYTRHPNYFFQWLGWVGITLSAIPALIALQNSVTAAAWIIFAVLLLYVPIGSYLMMVYYTGSIPAEVYTVQTRTEYAEYQRTTNMFFPGPPRAPSARTAARSIDDRRSITVDEHGLPRLPDGRRWVEVIHAPWYLETPSHVIPVVGIAAFFYLSDVFKEFEMWNIAIHLLIFIPTVHIPALVTGKMSWIDLSWPLGLLALGYEIVLLGSAPFLHRAVVGLEYFLIGARMAVWILANWHIVRKGRELPRYQYRRLVWEQRPFLCGLVTNTSISMQLEICEQWVWNVTWLCLPAMLHAFDTEASWHVLEILGHGIWAISFICETIGDKQKYEFVLKCQKEGTEARLGRTGGKVCDVGLWHYTRHPNYFFQWLGWVGITLSSIPALLRLQGATTSLAWVTFAVLLFYVPIGSYLMMVYYTGCIPAEVYTVQTRTEYAVYQKTTNMFFPGPSRANPEQASSCESRAPLLNTSGHFH